MFEPLSWALLYLRCCGFVPTFEVTLSDRDPFVFSRLRLWRAGEVVWIQGRVQDNRPHKHHALQIVWSMPDTAATLRMEGQDLMGSCVIVEGGAPHALELEFGLIALIDAASQVARRLRTTHLSHGARWKVLEGFAFQESQTHDAYLQELLLDAPEPLDERIRDVLRWLDALEEEGRWEEVSLEHALTRTYLSRSRFLHLFSSQVGSPWRTYLVWRRALVAITLASHGTSLTQAAHQAGYSDAAHLSRQFLALFGLSPSALLKNSQFVQS